MPSAYLQGGDIAAFSPGATQAQIQQASLHMNAYLRRREGLLWKADANGAPLCMDGASPRATLTLASGIAAGNSVVATVTGPTGMLIQGEPLVIERDNAAVAEVCTITGISGQTVTLSTVVNAHATGAKLLAGLTCYEEKPIPEDRPVVRAVKAPVVSIFNGVGTYRYPRRGGANRYMGDDLNLLATISNFGGPPAWQPCVLTMNNVNQQTGEIWIPAGMLLAYFSQVRVWYIAGYTYDTLPDQVKQACANVIAAQANFAELNGNIKRAKAGDTEIERFKDTIFDSDTRELLAPFRARLFA